MPARAVVEGAAGVMVAPSLSNGAGWASASSFRHRPPDPKTHGRSCSPRVELPNTRQPRSMLKRASSPLIANVPSSPATRRTPRRLTQEVRRRA